MNVIDRVGIFAVEGKSLIARWIKWRTSSIISHIGVVFQDPLNTHQKLVIESSSLILLPDLATRKRRKGVQMHRLEDRIIHVKQEHESCYYYPLVGHLDIEKYDATVEWLYTMHQSHIPYDFKQIFGAAFDFFDEIGWKNTKNSDALFCSELVTEALQIAGLVDKDIIASEQTPKDVLCSPCVGLPVLL